MRKLSLALVGALSTLALPAFAEGLACPPVGVWLDPRTGQTLTAIEAIDRLSEADVVVLGESHGVRDVQLWEATTAAAVADRRGGAQYAYEMLPRSSQKALDAWASGESDLPTFLDDAGWASVWGFPAEAYDPILRLPRLRGAPAIALNVDPDTRRRLGGDGWEATPEAEREGVTRPADALPAYRARLQGVVDEKARLAAAAREKKDDDGGAPHAAAPPVMALDRMVAGQLVWDRAFADAIKSGLDREPELPVIAFMGRFHVEYAYGVVHQLADMGVANVLTAVPVFQDEACAIEADVDGRPLADLVYGIPAFQQEPGPPARPRIGVFIEDAGDDGGAKVSRVVDGSPAEAAGFAADDIVVEAAGRPVTSAADLGAEVRKHSWGAWLPFKVKRGDQTLDLVAKLPRAPS